MLLELPLKSTGKKILVNIANTTLIGPLIEELDSVSISKGIQPNEFIEICFIDGSSMEMGITYDQFKSMLVQPTTQTQGTVAADNVDNIEKKLNAVTPPESKEIKPHGK